MANKHFPSVNVKRFFSHRLRRPLERERRGGLLGGGEGTPCGNESAYFRGLLVEGVQDVRLGLHLDYYCLND